MAATATTRCYGMDGNDTLRGENGNDTLNRRRRPRQPVRRRRRPTPSSGSSTGETGLTAATADVVADFNRAEGDRIDLSAIDADVYAAGNQAFTFIGTAAFSGTPGEIRYYHVRRQHLHPDADRHVGRTSRA